MQLFKLPSVPVSLPIDAVRRYGLAALFVGAVYGFAFGAAYGLDLKLWMAGL